MEHVCANCNHHFTDKYCGNCGQKWDVPSFTFKHIFEEAFHAFTHADKSFLQFIKKMFLAPGKVAYEYIAERKRKQYFNPFTFFLLISAINAFITSFEISLKDKLFHYNNEYGHLFNVYDKVLSLIAIPIIAFGIWLIHIAKRKFRYSEYTVFAMMLVSLYSLVECMVHAVNYGFTILLHKDISLDDNLIYLLLMIAYIAYANRQFHSNRQNSNWLKSILAGVFFFAVLIAVKVFVIFAYVNDFQGIGNLYMYGIRI